MSWISALAELQQQGEACVLVTIIEERGSTPRNAGSKMVVTAERIFETIGGGHLEYKAMEMAREMLASRSQDTRLERFSLGASLGQCCGGVVHLLLEPMGATQAPWIERAAALAAAGRAWGRSLRFGCNRVPEVQVFDADSVEHILRDPAHLEHARRLLTGGADDTVLLTGLTPSDPLPGAAAGGMKILLDASPPPALRVMLFGAGHVGRALAEIFGRLPLRVRWIDPRAAEFPAAVASNIEVCCTDDPESEVRQAQADTIFLVLTHSHALDFELVRAILDRGDFRLCGLLGSQSKRARFAQRLRARGVAEHAIAQLRCPLGMPGLGGKEPEVIAIAIAAQVLQLRGSARAKHPMRDATLA